MADAQSPIWLFLKNFSNKFSISDLVPGNERKGNAGRKSITYNKLQTHDKGDFLSSSNPNLLDIVGKGTVKVPETDQSLNTLPQSGSSRNIKHPLTQSQTKERLKSKSSEEKKFTFNSRVPNYQDEEDEENDQAKGNKGTFGHEDSDDNWIECEEDDEDESDFAEEEDEEDARRCGYCGCEKKYVITEKSGD